MLFPGRCVRARTTVRPRPVLAAAISVIAGSSALGAGLSWDGDGSLPVSGGSGIWDTVSPRWSNGTTLLPWNDAAGDDPFFVVTPGTVLLDGTRAAKSLNFSVNFTLLSPDAGANVNLGTGNVIDTGSARIDLRTGLAGTGGIAKNGSGILVLHGSNAAITGAWQLNAGTTALGSSAAGIPDASAVNIAAGATLDLGFFGGAYNDTIAGLSGSGDIRLVPQTGFGALTGSTLTVVPAAGTTSTWAGVISGTGGRLIKAGSGSLVINNTQTYTGVTQLNGGSTSGTAGALILDASGALSPQSSIIFGSGSLNATTLSINANKTLGSLSNGGSLSIVNMGASSLTIGADNRNVGFNGVVSGSGRLTKTGTGIQSFGTNASSWAGGLTIQGGAFLAQLDSRLGAVPGAFDPTNITLDGGSLGNFAGTSLGLNANRGITVTSNNGGIIVADSATTLSVPGVITGAGRITKTGPGILSLGASNTFANGMSIQDGAVTSAITSGSPLGTGSITLSGATLSLIPAAVVTNVTLTQGDLSYGPGSNIVLSRNFNTTLTAAFGAISAQTGGTLVILPASGIAELGGAGANFTRMTGSGVVNNVNGGVPGTNGDIASPAIISTTTGTNLTGEFVRYGTNGFEPGIYSISANINTANNTDVFDAAANQAIATSASVFALKVRNGVTVSGGNLNIGAGSLPATVILNSGSITASTLNFGSRQGIIYAGGANATLVGNITSNITGTGGITKIGDANLRLSTASTFSGGLTIGGGTVTTAASNILPSSTDLTLTGRGANGSLTTARLAIGGTSQTIRSLSSTGMGGTIDLGPSGSLTVNGTVDSHYRGAIVGTTLSNLVKEGTGVLTLGELVNTSALPSTTNTYQRLIIRNGGVVSVAASQSLPPALDPGAFPVLNDTISLNAGTLRITSINDSAAGTGSTFPLASGNAQRGLTLGASGGIIQVTNPLETVLLQQDDVTSRNIVRGTGNLTKAGPGALRLGPGNSYTGNTIVLEGSLQIPTDSALGAAPGAIVFDSLQIQNGAMLQSTGNGSLHTNRGITLLGGSGTISNQFAQATFDTTSGALVINRSITGPGAMKKVGPGSNPLQLNDLNDFQGNFIIEAGRVNFNESDSAGLAQVIVKPLHPVVLGMDSLDDTTLTNPIELLDGAPIDVDVPGTGGAMILTGDISGPGGMTKRGTGALVLSGTASSFAGQLNVLGGTVTATSDLALGSTVGPTFVAPGAVLALEGVGSLSIAEPVQLAGTLRNTSGDNTLTSNLTLMRDSTVNVAGGSLNLGPVTSRANLIKTGTGLLTAQRLDISTLNVNEASARLSQKATVGIPADTTRLTALLISGGTTPTAKLDITNNALVIDYGPADAEPFDTIRSQIVSGFNAGAWDGDGIVTSLATAGETGIGYAEALALGGTIPAVFGTVDATAVLVRYTRLGDANLDGTVTLQDFNRLALNFGSTTAVWSQGDFTYDGQVTLQDFNRLALNFGLSAGPGGPTPADWAALAAAVPEPAGLWLAGLSGILLKRRRIG